VVIKFKAMSLIASVKKSLFQRKLLREIRQRQAKYQPKPVNPATAKCVAVLFNADDLDDRKTAENYRQARKKVGLKTELLGYLTREVNAAGLNFDHFTTKDLNWYGVPGGSSVGKFLERPCNLLIALGDDYHPQRDFLAAIKNTDLRVGPYTENPDNPYDVQYTTKGAAAEPKEQLNQIDKIFKVTNAATTAVI
jgi:hypothetical protein